MNIKGTEAKCPYCNHNEAFFMQIQIRSADEPSTLHVTWEYVNM